MFTRVSFAAWCGPDIALPCGAPICEARPRGAQSASQCAHACHSELRTGAGHAISKAAAHGAPSCMQRPRRDEVGLADRVRLVEWSWWWPSAHCSLQIIGQPRAMSNARALSSRYPSQHCLELGDASALPVSLYTHRSRAVTPGCFCQSAQLLPVARPRCSCLSRIAGVYCERRRCDDHSPSPAPSRSAVPSAVTTNAPVLWQVPRTGAPRLSQSGGGAV